MLTLRAARDLIESIPLVDTGSLTLASLDQRDAAAERVQAAINEREAIDVRSSYDLALMAARHEFGRFPQYAAYWEGWTLSRAKRRVTTKRGVAVEVGDLVLTSPKPYAIEWLGSRYRHERDEEQPFAVYLGVEKAGMRSQLMNWFGDPLGLPVIALGGYASQTLKDQVWADVGREVKRFCDGGRRESVFIYAGDFDASGEDIPRDFLEQTNCFDHVIRVALTPAQVEEFKLPPQPGKHSDSRAKKFAEKYEDLFMDVYGMDLVQIELDAIPPDDLKRIYQEEIDRWFDHDLRETAIEREDEERDLLIHGEMAREPRPDEVWFGVDTGLRFQVVAYEPPDEDDEQGWVDLVSVRHPDSEDGYDSVTFRRRFKPLTDTRR